MSLLSDIALYPIEEASVRQAVTDQPTFSKRM
jgi:hypothetical protein